MERDLEISGRGKPRARLIIDSPTEARIRIDCDRDSAVWYEVPVRRKDLVDILAAMDYLATETEGPICPLPQ